MPKVRIGHWQLAAVLGNLVFGKAIGFTSQALARAVGRDAWIAMLLAFLLGFPLMAAIVWLANRFGDETPAQYLPRLAGRWMGGLALLVLALYFLGSYVTSALTIVLHINDYLMTETPLIIFVVLYTLLVVFAVHLGIEVAGRLAVLGLAMTILLDLLVIAGAIDHFDYTRLLPVLEDGPGPSLLASLIAHTDVSMAVAGAFVLLPLTGRPQRWLRLSWIGLGVGTLITSMWPLFEVAVLSHEVTAQYLISCMQLARAAELSIWLHRYELLMVIFFVYGVLTQSIVCLYCATELTAAALPFKLGRPWLILICAVLTMPLQTYLGYDRDLYGLVLMYVWPAIALPVGYGVPLLMCGLALLRPQVRATGSAAG